MKSYTITVNGNAYDVTVEETGATASAPVAAAPRAAAPAPAAAPAGGAGSITAPMPGTVLDVKVTEGQAVNAGDTVLILEAMKMETPVVAPEDGTVASIDVTVGQAVEAGALLATLK